MIQWCNASFDRLAGRPHLSLLGRRVEDVLILEREGRRVASVRELLDNAASARPGAAVYERSGARELSLLEISATRTEVGGAASVVLALRDVTEQKRSEAALAAKNSELETLLHVIAHDLREPLRSLENFSSLLDKDYGGGLAGEARDHLHRITRASARMRRLLDDIMLLARARRLDATAGPVDFSAVAAEVVSRLEGEISRTGGAVRIVEPLPRLKADRTWATQALYNLVANALKFAREGRAPEVEIAPYAAAGAVLGIAVRDRGPGVRPEDAERIFLLFQRAVGREVEGTGAGLAIVRAVAERHGGRAWVGPRDGGGSEFIITFGSAA